MTEGENKKIGQGLNYYEIEFAIFNQISKKGKMLSLLSCMSIRRVMMSQHFQLTV
jgi:hypothetical protein